MKAFQIKHHAHPREHPVSDIAPPIPAADEVLVDIYAAGLNFFDVLQAQNLYQHKPPLPFTLGVEFAGRVSANSPIPPGCKFKRGDRVIGRGLGAYAEQNAVSPANLLPLPDNMSYEQGAAFYVAYPTSYEAIVGRAQAKKGEWVLVHAAAGGVGVAAVQIAKGLGCRVIGTASTPAKRDVALRAGADYAVDYTQSGWQDEVKKITGGGVDVVYDPVGLLIPSLKVVNWNARLLVVGFAGGSIEKIPANLVLLKNVSVLGVRGGQTSVMDPARYAKTIEACFDMVANEKVKPVLYERVYEGLEELAEGLVDLEGRKVWGKAVVRIRKADGAPAKL